MKTLNKKPLVTILLLLTNFLTLEAMPNISARKITAATDKIHGSRLEDAKNHGLFPSNCGKEVLRDVVLKNGNIQNYFNRCGQYIRNNNHRLALIKYIRTRYPILADKTHRMLTFKLDDGTLMKGILVLNPSKVAKPLIMIKGGIYADAIFRGGSNNLLLHYTTEAPFHALYLESTTSKEYVRRNKSIAIGGLVESHQMIEILRQLENSKYASKISEVHLVGNSLGGNGALMFEQSLTHAQSLSSRFTPRSITAHCPVVNFKRSFANMFSPTLAGRGGVMYLRNILQELRAEVPLINLLFGSRSVNSCEPEELQHIMQSANSDFYRNYYRTHYESSNFDLERDLYEANDFRNVSGEQTIPTYIIHAKDDRVVRFKDNLGLMLETHGRELSPNVKTIVLEQGDHCAYGHVYNWGHMTTLYKSIIYRNSKERERSKVFNVKDEIQSDRTIFGNPSIRFKKGDAIADYYFKKHRDSKGLKLKFKIFRAQREKGSCGHYPYYQAPKACYDFESVYIAPQKLGFHQPRNDDEESTVLRQLNSQGMLLTQNGSDVRGKAVLPVNLKLSIW